LTTVLFEFVYGLKQAIYTQLVVICGQQNYTLNTKHAITGVVEKGMREAEVRGSIPNKFTKNSATCDFDGDGQVDGPRGLPNKNIFFYYF
jgi:hypothetical protein